jgi:hypothetical protein
MVIRTTRHGRSAQIRADDHGDHVFRKGYYSSSPAAYVCMLCGTTSAGVDEEAPGRPHEDPLDGEPATNAHLAPVSGRDDARPATTTTT